MGHSVQDAIEWMKRRNPLWEDRACDDFCDEGGCDMLRELLLSEGFDDSDWELAEEVRSLRRMCRDHIRDVTIKGLSDALKGEGPFAEFYAAAKGDGK